MKLDDFEILAVLGTGSYSTVYKANHKATSTLYALKELSKKQLLRLNKVSSAFLEKQLLTRLSHRNIVSLYATFQTEMFLYFVLEYIDGQHLQKYVEENWPLSTEKIKSIGMQLLDVLEYLGTERIVHLDLKPENVIVSCTAANGNVEVKVIDFGCALQLPLSCSEPLNLSNVGTSNYTHPLVFCGDAREIGESCDLWSFGCILYFLQHGKDLVNEKSDYLNMNRANELWMEKGKGKGKEIVFGEKLDGALFHSSTKVDIGELRSMLQEIFSY